MKKKKTALLLSAALAGVMTISLCACDLFEGDPVFDNKTPYEIATEQGYDGSPESYLASVIGVGSGGDSQVRIAYEEAKKEGYTGTFLDFLQTYLSLSVNDSANINRALTSVVSIRCGFQESLGGYRPSSNTQSVTSAGSGVIYSLEKENGNAYVITNYHVVYNADSVGTETTAHVSDNISLYLYGGELSSGAIRATYLGGAMNYDIAVLKVEGSEVLKQSSARAVVSANSDAVTVGEAAYAIGNPEGEGISVSGGIVSVDAEYIEIKSSDESTTLTMLEMRTDAPVNHGNSGGGLFDKDGKLVGIVNARSEETGVTAFGYAIPANLALSIAQNIIDNAPSGSRGALRATLGITVMTADSSSVYDATAQKTYIMETVTVQGVQSGAAASSLKAGDVFYSVKVTSHNDNERVNKVITRRHQIYSILFNMRLGDTLEITVSRGDELVTEKVVYSESSQFTLFD